MSNRIDNPASKPRSLAILTQKFNYFGVVAGLVVLSASLSPSLHPRPWQVQALISGIFMFLGYGLGIAISYVIRNSIRYEPPKLFKKYCWQTLVIVAPIAYALMVVQNQIWQSEVARLVEQTTPPQNHLLLLSVSIAVLFLALILFARVLLIAFRAAQRLADNYLPHGLSSVLILSVAGIAVFITVKYAIISPRIAASRAKYAAINHEVLLSIPPPSSQFRSGSAASFIPWSSLGFFGRKFIASGPNQAQLAKFSGKTPVEPIRIYAGIESAPTADSRAKLIVEEMERTGAFNRQVIVLAAPTGRGWLETRSIDTIEYIWNGNSAVVAQQYSDLPSIMSYLTDQDSAKSASQALYKAVIAKWSQLPKDQRPKLIAFGLSLGSMSSQSIASTPEELSSAFDGGLFIGTPSNTVVWQKITKNRIAGSPQWKPELPSGNHVKFASTNSDLNTANANWPQPRFLYLQHASDPLVWFNYSLIYAPPDWLNEPKGSDVSPNLHWFPVITFAQVTIDGFYSMMVSDGHGHNYGDVIAKAWSAVAAPTDWTDAKTKRLQAIMDNYTAAN